MGSEHACAVLTAGWGQLRVRGLTRPCGWLLMLLLLLARACGCIPLGALLLWRLCWTTPLLLQLCGGGVGRARAGGGGSLHVEGQEVVGQWASTQVGLQVWVGR